MELDSSLAEPRIVLASIKGDWDWDCSGAEAEFRQAIALNPNYPTAHHWFAHLLRSMNRLGEALAEMKLAQGLDPLSPIINVNVGYAQFLNGQADLAVETLKEQISLDPSFVVSHQTLALVYLNQGKTAEAISEFETMLQITKGGTYSLGLLGAAYARAGKTNEAQKIVTQIGEFQRQGSAVALYLAQVQHALGNDEGALTSLELAWAQRDDNLGELNYDPFWQDLRSHPRAQAILKQMNLVK